MSLPTFEEDLALMRRRAPVDVLEAPEGGRIAVSGRWQGRVMTSAVERAGPSLGFVNRAFIEAGTTGTPFDNYGGEDRFWLGPEAGQYGLYFAPGAEFALDSWQVPPAIQGGGWPSRFVTQRSISFTRTMRLVSYSGVDFDVAVERTVHLLDAPEVAARFGVAPPPRAKWVAFESVNRITNAGARRWSKRDGLLSIWILSMYPTSEDAVVIVPFVGSAQGRIVNDAYFGKVPADRLAVDEDQAFLLFACDGRHRSKIGIGPARATPTLGSYRPEAQLLTLAHYDLPAGAHDYVNSMWHLQNDPYDGDVVNSYNDGPVEASRPSLGFFEIETSSPAAALAPGESLVHAHATLHLTADLSVLDPVALRTLGVSLPTVRRRLPIALHD